VFAKFNQPAGYAPFSFARFVAAFDQHDFSVVNYDYAYADDWLVRIKPFHQMTLTCAVMLLSFKTALDQKRKK
jgi:hypothetical protein